MTRERLVQPQQRGVIRKLDAGVFDHLSGLFLGDLLYEVIRGEERALPQEVKDGLRSVVQERARPDRRGFHGAIRGQAAW